MPNWDYNVLGAHDEHGIKFIFDNCINDNKVFTFNKLIPMPQILMKGCSPTTICSNFDKFKEREIDKFNQYYLNENLIGNNLISEKNDIGNEK